MSLWNFIKKKKRLQPDKDSGNNSDNMMKLEDIINVGSTIKITSNKTRKLIFSTIVKVLDDKILISKSKNSSINIINESEILRLSVSENEFLYVIDGIVDQINEEDLLVISLKIIKHNNRRKHKRYYLDYEEKLIINNDKSNEVKCRIVNISKSGILICFSTVNLNLNKGQEYSFNITCQKRVNLNFNGVIVRKHKNDSNTNMDYGIQFTNIDTLNSKNIETIILNLEN